MGKNFGDVSKLPTQYFKRHGATYNNERDLVAGMGAEMLNHHGVRCEYILVSNDPQYDPVFGDDRNRRLLRKFELMLYFELPSEEDRWSAFGIEGLDNFSMFASIRHFSRRSIMGQPAGTVFYSPRVGDIIKPQYNDYYYEITAWYDGSTSMNFLQLDNVYEITVAKITNDHVADPNGLLTASIRDLQAKDIFDDSDFIDGMNARTDVVPTTFPTSTGKGKPSPLYKPAAGEKPPQDMFGGF